MSTGLAYLRAGACSVVSKQAAADPTRPTSVDLGLDMESTGGKVVDYLGLPWGRTRAGRATHLADATKYPDLNMNVRKPITSDIFNLLAGGGLGAVGGGLLGAGIGAYGGDANIGNAAGAGAAIGGIGGGVLGLYGGRGRRRQSMKDIAKHYDDGATADNTIRPRDTGTGLGVALTPFGGPHRAGQADVYEALNNQAGGDNGNKVTNRFNRDTLNSLFAASPLFGAAGAMIPTNVPIGGIVQMAAGNALSADAAERVKAVDKKRKEQLQAKNSERDTANTTKAANDWMKTLADGAKSVVSKVDLKNPLHTGAIGAGVGAMGGLAGSMLSEEQSKNKLRNALLGGLAGGGIGAGVNMLRQPAGTQAVGGMSEPAVVAAVNRRTV